MIPKTIAEVNASNERVLAAVKEATGESNNEALIALMVGAISLAARNGGARGLDAMEKAVLVLDTMLAISDLAGQCKCGKCSPPPEGVAPKGVVH